MCDWQPCYIYIYILLRVGAPDGLRSPDHALPREYRLLRCWCKKECPRLYKDRWGVVELDHVVFRVDHVGFSLEQGLGGVDVRKPCWFRWPRWFVWRDDCLPPVEVLLRMSACCCVTTTTVLLSVHVLMFWVCEVSAFDYIWRFFRLSGLVFVHAVRGWCEVRLLCELLVIVYFTAVYSSLIKFMFIETGTCLHVKLLD